MRIIDMHCDTISAILEAQKRGERAGLKENTFMLDLQRMQQGGYSVQNFALFVEQETGISSYDKVMELLSVFKAEMSRNEDRITQVTTTGEIAENEKAGRLSALLTVEGGEACGGSLDNLRQLYREGVRMMTITWNYPNELGFPNYSEHLDFYTPDCERGLTETGIAFVEEMEKLGMVIDVSHLSDRGFWDVVQYSKRPFVASHSNARAVCPWVRNLTDDMIRKLAERGGVTGLNYCGDFLRDPFAGTEKDRNQTKPGLSLAGKRPGAGSRADLSDLVKHARHMVNVGGIECLGLGSDFDGIPPYAGMPKAEHMEKLWHALAKGGFHEGEIEKIFYGNVFRLYKDVLG